MARRCVFSFHYQPDNSRAAQIRNMGMVDGNRPVPDNDRESTTQGGDSAIPAWTEDQPYGRSCTIVPVGPNTAERKWIDHEIVESWNDSGEHRREASEERDSSSKALTVGAKLFATLMRIRRMG